MFIVRHKSTNFDGTAPVLQYGKQRCTCGPCLSNLTQSNLGYGGFNVSIDPSFSATILTFLKNYGVIYAVPNIRGGGEFGEEWHLAGCREKKVGCSDRQSSSSHLNPVQKSNCFDDFIAATYVAFSASYHMFYGLMLFRPVIIL
jgi:hypothetical protein